MVRDGSEKTLSVKLGRRTDGSSLIPENITGEQVEYLVEGGFIIRELSGRYLKGHGPKWRTSVDPRLVNAYLSRNHAQKATGERIVILSSVLPDPINVGYQNFREAIITHINGTLVKNMKDVFAIADREGGVGRITLQSSGVDIVIDKDAIKSANARLARLHRIPLLRYQRKVPRQ